MTVRSARPEDEASVVGLWKTCGLVESYNDPSADFQFAIAGFCSDVLIGETEAGDVRGSVMVGHDGHRGWLYYVATDPNARGAGYGRDMIEAAELWLQDRGITKVQLLVRETNGEVVSFYKRLGFGIEHRTVMAKWLVGPQ